jgi:hypothetical protein
MIRRLLLRPLLVASSALLAQPASYLSPESAINKAGRQRMLSELMMKEYLQQAENISAAAARGHLQQAVEVFEDQIADLKAFAAGGPAAKTVAELEARWQAFRPLVTGTTSRRGIAPLLEAGAALHDAAQRNVDALQAAHGGPASKLADLSGRQRMLSQRIAKNYMLLSGTMEEPGARAELKLAGQEFERAHAELLAAAASDDIRAELETVGSIWQAVRPMLERSRDTAPNRTKVVDGTDAILVHMERATAMFEKQGKR